jgi:hypothetical protein
MLVMTTPGPSLTVTFENPKSRAAGVALGMKGREKLGVPYIEVDGVEHAGDWGAPTRVDITPGSHQIEVYFKLKGIALKRGKGKADFTSSDGDVSVHANFGQYATTTEVKVPGQALIRKKRMVF